MRDDVGCDSLFFKPSPSSYSFVDGDDGGGKRVSYRHPSLQSERARGDGGCIGEGHIVTWQGEESGGRDNVGCDSLFFDQSPPSYSFLDGDNGRGERVSYRHPLLQSERTRGNRGCIGRGHITTG